MSGASSNSTKTGLGTPKRVGTHQNSSKGKKPEVFEYFVVSRSQHAKKGSSGFSGPDKYVALVGVPVRPETEEKEVFNPSSTPIHTERLRKRGYFIAFLGEGYSQHTGPNSALGMAIRKANNMKKDLEEEQNAREYHKEFNLSLPKVAFVQSSPSSSQQKEGN